MNPYISKLIDTFDGNNYQQFLRYVYQTFQREIDFSKGKQKNKYIEIRNDVLNYIVSNEKNIVLELSRNRYQ